MNPSATSRTIPLKTLGIALTAFGQRHPTPLLVPDWGRFEFLLVALDQGRKLI
jgi:hypothetical protein